METFWSRRRRDDRATSAVEFSIVGPVFLLLVFLIIQVGLWYHAKNVALTAARQGVSSIRLAGTSAEPDAFQERAEILAEIAADQIGMLSDVDARSEIDEETGRVEVTVTGVANLPLGDIEVEETATAVMEEFRPDLRDR